MLFQVEVGPCLPFYTFYVMGGPKKRTEDTSESEVSTRISSKPTAAVPGPSIGTNEAPEERPGTPESEKKCAICLGELVNKSYSSSCKHEFCYSCLLEWSKIKPECPLCKTAFRSIYYNIRGEGGAEFDVYKVPHFSIRLTTPP